MFEADYFYVVQSGSFAITKNEEANKEGQSHLAIKKSHEIMYELPRKGLLP